MDYSLTFWKRAYELVDGPKQCQQCKMWQNLRTRPRIIVRLVLEGDGKPIAQRLRMLCLTCAPGPREVKLPRKQILSKIMELPFASEGPPSAETDAAQGTPEKVRTQRGSR